jgi:hypothetical protein
MTGLVQLYSLAASANAMRLEMQSERIVAHGGLRLDAPVELREDRHRGEQLVADREDMAEESVDCGQFET